MLVGRLLRRWLRSARSVLAAVPVERSLIFHPAQYPDGDWDREGEDFEDAWFAAADGTRLHGWFLSHPARREVVLFCHGNAGNITNLAEALRLFNQRHGLAVMAFDYRGFGRSEGKPTEEGILQDARAARAWLARRTGVAESDIILMGRSLGGAVAVDLAAKDGARGLILESTFTSLPAVASYQIPLLPAGLLMSMRLDSLSKIAQYNGPLLCSHGDADTLIPLEQGRELFEAAPGPKRFITICGGGHNNPQSDECRQALDEFLELLE